MNKEQVKGCIEEAQGEAKEALGKIRNNFVFLSAACVFFLVFNSPSINAAHYTFKQSGFTDGGIITGSFDGEDTVGNLDDNGINIPDGIINVCNGRACDQQYYDHITSFSIHFSGSSFFRKLNQLADAGLYGLEYDIASNTLKLGFGTDDVSGNIPFLSYNAGFFNSGGTVLLFTDTDVFESTTPQGLSVSQSPVPLPAALCLFLLGLGGISLIRRKTTSKLHVFRAS